MGPAWAPPYKRAMGSLEGVRREAIHERDSSDARTHVECAGEGGGRRQTPLTAGGRAGGARWRVQASPGGIPREGCQSRLRDPVSCHRLSPSAFPARSRPVKRPRPGRLGCSVLVAPSHRIRWPFNLTADAHLHRDSSILEASQSWGLGARPPLTAPRGREGITLRASSTDIYRAPPGAVWEAGAEAETSGWSDACPPRRPDHPPRRSLPGAGMFPEPGRVRRRAGGKWEDVQGTRGLPRTHTCSSEECAGVGVGGPRGVRHPQVHRGGGGRVCEGRRGQAEHLGDTPL